jgi:cell fate regulator YaaT (PSP1 superfamily)
LPLAVKVAFRPGGKVYLFSPAGLNLKYDNEVIVETEKGMELARVVSCSKDVDEADIVTPLKDVVRIATEEDKIKIEKNKQTEEEYLFVGRSKAKDLNLDMKIVNAELSYDGKSVTFHFTAEQRVDFRQLVKDLNTELKIKTDLRQIGARDEAKFIDGYGCCGQRICCAQFIGGFDPVSIKMAKEQNLPLNPSKISGNCGRLMCCLKYENSTYHEFKCHAPKIGDTIKTVDGTARVVDYNVVKETLIVSSENGVRQEYKLSEVKKV